MIVKSVECVSTPDTGDDSETKKEVIYTVVKIYKEKEEIVKEKIKHMKSLGSNFTFSDNVSFSSKTKGAKTDDNTSYNSKSKKGGDDDRSSQGSKSKGAEEKDEVK